MKNKILFVDDEENVLAAFQRQLRNRYEFEVASSGADGLEIIEQHGPFAVVVADMRMPGMDGVLFLARVKEIAGDTVRMMLTGNADMQTAIDAVNRGHIFRFLTKPCPAEVLSLALDAGIKQYQLVTAEKELLEKTLTGSIKMLTEVLSLVNPTAFSQALRMRRIVRHITHELQLPDAWQYELAAMLSQIGCITLPPELEEKISTQKALSEVDQLLFQNHPAIGQELLVQIPRLELIAQMVANQQKTQWELYEGLKAESGDERLVISQGAQMLKGAQDFDQLMLRGMEMRHAIRLLRERPGEYRSDILNALETLPDDFYTYSSRLVSIQDLKVGMIVVNEVRDEFGRLVLARRQEITYPVLLNLQAQHKQSGRIKSLIRVATL